jgi:hypothetical protein
VHVAADVSDDGAIGEHTVSRTPALIKPGVGTPSRKFRPEQGDSDPAMLVDVGHLGERAQRVVLGVLRIPGLIDDAQQYRLFGPVERRGANVLAYENQAQRMRERLGLDPLADAQLAKTRSEAVLSAVDLESIRQRGREAFARRETAALAGTAAAEAVEGEAGNG